MLLSMKRVTIGAMQALKQAGDVACRECFACFMDALTEVLSIKLAARVEAIN